MQRRLLACAMNYKSVRYRESANVGTHTLTKAFFMDNKIQFRVDEETKRLAQKMAESQGRTLSDACRDLTEQLADQQRCIS